MNSPTPEHENSRRGYLGINLSSARREKYSNVLQIHIVIVGQVRILVFLFMSDILREYADGYVTLYQSLGKNDIFALVLQSLYVSGECYCTFLSVYEAVLNIIVEATAFARVFFPT